jgi:hypothetical protein
MMARAPHDHGEATDAIDYALDELRDFTDTFLRCWREGNLTEWPEYYAWLDKREADLKAWRAAEKKRLKGFRLHPADTSLSGRRGNTPADGQRKRPPESSSLPVKEGERTVSQSQPSRDEGPQPRSPDTQHFDGKEA